MPDTHDERGGDEAPLCSTPCDPDCDAVCHDDHVEGHKKQHWPYDCPAADRYFDEYFRVADGFVAEVIKRLRGERDEAREQLAAATARAESATVLPDRWRALRVERDAANERAEKAEALVEHLDKARDSAVREWKREHDAADALQRERDEARELARASLDILRNVSDEPMRELFEVDDMDELPGWFTGYGKPSDAVAPDAPQDGLSGPGRNDTTEDGQHG